MRSGLEERRERGSFGLSRAIGRLDNQRLKSVGAHKSRYPTKQQGPPSWIKFLQERLDHSWDVHTTGQAFALV